MVVVVVVVVMQTYRAMRKNQISNLMSYLFHKGTHSRVVGVVLWDHPHHSKRIHHGAYRLQHFGKIPIPEGLQTKKKKNMKSRDDCYNITKHFESMWTIITLFKSITMLCGTNNIL